MRIATWNVNSIKAHLEQVMAWVKSEKPDVLCLQEIKCEDHAFPTAVFEKLGYTCEVHGQKTWHGVAFLSKVKIESVARRLPGDDADEHSRFIMGTVFGASRPITVAGLYLPNGNPAPGPKYDYKLAWMKRLTQRAQALLASEEAFVLTGDFNVIPAVADMKRPETWVSDALFLPETRTAYEEMMNLGLTDAFRALHPDEVSYSFWDYQAGAWQKNNGIRIDHHLLSPQAADMLVSAKIYGEARGMEKPSDHVPVMIELQ